MNRINRKIMIVHFLRFKYPLLYGSSRKKHLSQAVFSYHIINYNQLPYVHSTPSQFSALLLGPDPSIIAKAWLFISALTYKCVPARLRTATFPTSRFYRLYAIIFPTNHQLCLWSPIRFFRILQYSTVQYMINK